MPILTDTSFFFAVAHQKDDCHVAAVRALRDLEDAELAMPVTILAEMLGLAGSRLGVARQRQIWGVFRSSGIEVVSVGPDVLEEARRIDERYADVGYGFADCTLLASCEALRTARVLSFNRRLAAYRPSFASALEVMP